jgi:hypothetical protein
MEEIDEVDQTPVLDLSDMGRYVSNYSFVYWKGEYEERSITLELRGHVGEDRWAIKDGHHCYNRRTRRWEYERLPSGRSDRFLRDCRYTLAEARPLISRLVFELHDHARRRVARLIRNHHDKEQAKIVKEEGTDG